MGRPRYPHKRCLSFTTLDMCSTHIQRCHVLVWLGDIPEERSVPMMRKNWFVRSGILTHALIRGPEFSQIPIKEPRQCLESGALDHSAILTLTFVARKTFIPSGDRTQDLWIRSPTRYPLR